VEAQADLGADAFNAAWAAGATLNVETAIVYILDVTGEWAARNIT
jgi:hypothetical protein